MTTITAIVNDADIDAAIEEIVQGAKPQFACPVQRALQAHVERVAIVFQASWHLGAQGKTPPTKGVALPASAVAFIAAFDAYAKAVQSFLRYRPDDLETAKSESKGRPAGLTFTVDEPSKPMVESKPVPS